MKKSLYLYLFLFASLIALILYINGRNMQEALVDQVKELQKERKDINKRLTTAQLNTAQADSFTLKGNQEALNHFEGTNVDVVNLEATLFDALLELNATKEGNKLVPYLSDANGYRINDMKVINHKWVLVNFSDTRKWGEMLLEYTVEDDNSVTFEVANSILYKAYK
jgi:hypothetical protein